MKHHQVANFWCKSANLFQFTFGNISVGFGDNYPTFLRQISFVFYIVSDDWNREMEPLLNIILGGLLANVASVSSFYFGNSHKGED